MIYTTSKYYLDHILKYICLSWGKEDGIDYTLKQNHTFHGNAINAEENYGFLSSQSMCDTFQMVRLNYSIQPFTDVLPWKHHQFYVNRFRP